MNLSASYSAAYANRSSSRFKRGWAVKTIVRCFLFLYTLGILFPFYWAISMSLKSNETFFTNIWGLPSKLHFENYARAWNKANIGDYFFNSVIVTGSFLVLIVVIGSLVSYVLAKFPFKGRYAIKTLFVLPLLIPDLTGVLSLFLVLSKAGLLNSLSVLVLVYVVSVLPFTVFLLSSFFETVPTEIGEAARIDGCSYYGTFWRIMFPLAMPGIATITIFNFFNIWNEFILALTLLKDPAKYTIAVGIVNLHAVQQYYTDWSALFAGLMIITIPTFVVYLLFRRKITQGLTLGAIK